MSNDGMRVCECMYECALMWRSTAEPYARRAYICDMIYSHNRRGARVDSLGWEIFKWPNDAAYVLIPHTGTHARKTIALV